MRTETKPFIEVVAAARGLPRVCTEATLAENRLHTIKAVLVVMLA